MFSDVNSLIFLLIFLSFMAVCLMVYHRVYLSRARAVRQGGRC